MPAFTTFHFNCRLVCVAPSKVRLEGCVSGAACRVWISLEGALRGLEPTMLICLILNLVRTERTVSEALHTSRHVKNQYRRCMCRAAVAEIL